MLPWQPVVQIVVSMVMNRGGVHAYLYQTNSCFVPLTNVNIVTLVWVLRVPSHPKR